MDTMTFDATALRRGIEERDAATLLGLYAEDAELRITDHLDQPSNPKVIRGRAAIGGYFADVCGRDMTHTVERLVVGPDGAAFTQVCRYPSGARVLCSAVLDLRDGLIVRQSCVQAWDEEQPAAVTEHRDFADPDETREFPSGKAELLSIGGSDIGRLVLRPGWRWSEHVKPIAGTDLCEAPHFQYHVAGVLRIQMADGTTFDARPGAVTALPSGHDAWVVGEEPVVVVDWWGASNYAKG
ncbi:MAG TPA: nuclear transport factor 2 family protein [Streptosporangiaceae bacterium]|nr:nuclear transport factor 2 family protein [Streptosporangiaceae bacterium]